MLSIRQKTILQSIFEHPEGISSRQLSELLRVSKKTIRNDVAAVNQWLKEAGCFVSASQKSGYFIEEENKNKINDILEELNQPEPSREVQTPQERRFAVLDRILGRPGTGIYMLAERLCVSEQTIYKDIAFLERMLEEDYDFRGLTVQNGRILMQAPEHEIRRMVFCMLTSRILESGQLMDNCLYNLMRGIVNLNEIHTFYQYVEDYCRKAGIVAADQLLYICTWVVFYTNVRREEAYFLDSQERFERNDGLSEILRAMNQNFFLELEECDLELMYQYLQAAGFPGSSPACSQEGEALFLDMEEQLKDQFGISLAEEAEVRESFCRNLTYLLCRVRLRTQLGPEVFDRRREWPELIRQAVQLLCVLVQRRCGVSLKAGELDWIAEYLMAGAGGCRTRIRALILYGADEGRYYRVRRWIREQFRQEVVICGACPRYMAESAGRELLPDLLIATQPMDIRAELPKLMLSGALSEAEKRRMKDFFDDLSEKKRLAAMREFLVSRVQVRVLKGRMSLEDAAAKCWGDLAERGCVCEKDREAYGSAMAADEGSSRLSDKCWFYVPAERTAVQDGICICIASDPSGPVRAAAAAALMPWKGNKAKKQCGGLPGLGGDWVCEAIRELFQSPEQVEGLLELSDPKLAVRWLRDVWICEKNRNAII